MKYVEMPGGTTNGNGMPTSWAAVEALIAPEPWTADALCAQVDPELFFPGQGGSVVEPKAICASCDVAAECLAFALRTREQFGIYGGMTAHERRRLLRGEAA